MEGLRLPFFVIALILIALAVLCELAATDILVLLTHGGQGPETPGLAINYLAIFDGLLAYTSTIMALGLTNRALVGRVQGLVTLVVSFFGLLGAIALVIVAFILLTVMVTLLVAVPFGTLAYLAAWGHFATGAAAVTLSLVMVLKIAFCICLLLAHQGFLKNKGLIILAAASLALTWLVGFLHAFPLGFLVSIADAIAALIIAIVGAIWLLVLLVGSILAVVTTLQTGRLPTNSEPEWRTDQGERFE